MESLKALLDAIDPKVWYLATSGVIWLVTWLWRRYLPGLWATVTQRSPAFAQLPLFVLGAILNAGPALGKPLWDVVQQSLLGAVLALIGANGAHAVLKSLPGPYDGAQKRVNAAEEKLDPPPTSVTPPKP